MCAFDKSKKEEIFTKAVRAGKRTYFFDVKVTSNGDKYLTITERKRKVNQRTGEFFYEKHKIFLYQEDFDKFTQGLSAALNFIKTGQLTEEESKVFDQIDETELHSYLSDFDEEENK